MTATPLAMLALAFTFSVTAPVPRHIMPRDSDEPLLSPGTAFVYRNEDGKDETRVVTRVDDNEIGKQVTISLKVGDTVVLRELLAVSADGISRVGHGEDWFEFCGRLTGRPGQAATEWVTLAPHGSKEFRTSGAVERVKVAAGTFDAVRVLVTQKMCTGVETAFTEWYSPGVGLIKSMTDDGQTITELKEIRRPTR
jgi:hypothetical protein